MRGSMKAGAACETRVSARVVPRFANKPISRVVARSSSKLSDVPLFGGSTSDLLGPSTSSAGQAKQQPKLDEVPLTSTVNMDYTALRDYLAEGEWKKAEDETRALLIKLAGPDAIKRNWVYFTEVKTISVEDMQTLDNLWKTASNGKFGYSVQKELWVQSQKRWAKFFKTIDWVQGPNNVYRKWPSEFDYSLNAPKGHMPLTSALRGTQLFQAIMEHPAYEKVQKKSIDESSRDAAKATMKLPGF